MIKSQIASITRYFLLQDSVSLRTAIKETQFLSFQDLVECCLLKTFCLHQIWPFFISYPFWFHFLTFWVFFHFEAKMSFLRFTFFLVLSKPSYSLLTKHQPHFVISVSISRWSHHSQTKLIFVIFSMLSSRHFNLKTSSFLNWLSRSGHHTNFENLFDVHLSSSSDRFHFLSLFLIFIVDFQNFPFYLF